MSNFTSRSAIPGATLSLDDSFQRLSLGDDTFSDTQPSLNSGRWPPPVQSDMFSYQNLPEIFSSSRRAASSSRTHTPRKPKPSDSFNTPSRPGRPDIFQTGGLSTSRLDSISEGPSLQSRTNDAEPRIPPTQRRTKPRVSEYSIPPRDTTDTGSAPSTSKRRPRHSEPAQRGSDLSGTSKPKQTASGNLAEIFADAYIPLSDRVKPPLTSLGGFELAPHQKVGVAWMISQENLLKNKRGGILGDDTGLGKTVQSCALIKHDLDQHPKENLHKPTLVIVPNHGLVAQWESECQKFIPGVSVHRYHGANKAQSMQELCEYGIVLTTYATVRNEWSELYEHAGRRQGKVYLQDVIWRRIFLDEAHTMRNPATKTAQACCALKSYYSWCLTATALQNDAYDLHSIWVFIQYEPFADRDWYRQNIGQPLKNGANHEEPLRLLHSGLAMTFLRRRKDGMTNGKKNLDLPNYQLHHFDCDLSPREREIYIALQNKFSALINRYKLSISYVLVLLLRLRQVCLHPTLLLKNYKEDAVDEEGSVEEDDSDEEYNGTICKYCNSKLPLTETDVHLEACKATIQILEPYIRSKQLLGSERVDNILAILRQIPAGEKTIVFSSFTSFFDTLEQFMDNFRYTRYDGQMRNFQREHALKSIRQDPSCNVILVSLKAGGVGLNIAECNHIILADIWWNPAVEEQAIGRVHRMGQTRQVHVYRLVAEETIETRILELQGRKRQLAKAALDSTELEEARKLSLNLNQAEAIALVTGKKRKHK